jgi:hypothetical protein
MPDLNFSVASVEMIRFAVSPMIVFKLRVSESEGGRTKIQSVALRCQIHLEPTKRRYTEEEQKKLFELFGEPERWGRTLRPMLWTHANVTVGPFQGVTEIDLPVPCTFDFNVAATKYFAGLSDGVVPLNLMFSGSVFYESDELGLQVTQISWNKEAQFRLPVSVWQEMMDHYYPNTAWLSLRRDVFEQLNRYRVENGMTTWEQVLERIIPPPSSVPFNENLAVEGSLPS